MDRKRAWNKTLGYRLLVALGVTLISLTVIATALDAKGALPAFFGILSSAFGTVLCGRSALNSRSRIRYSWSLFAVGGIASIALTVAVLVHDAENWVALDPVNISLALFQTAAILGCLTLVALPVAPAARARALLDQLIIGMVAGVVAWEAGYQGMFANVLDTASVIVLFIRAVEDCLMATMVVSICLALRPRGRLATPVLALVSIGLVGFVALDIAATHVHGLAVGAYPWFAAAASSAMVGLGLASAWGRPLVRRTPRLTRGLAYGQLLPSIAAAGVLVVILAESNFSAEQDSMLEWLASSLVACVLVRQVISWLEEQRLMQLLEARVADRTEQLGRRERQFKALVQHSSDVIMIVKSDGSCAYVSPSVQYVLGHSSDELLKGNILDVVHDEDRSRVLALMAMSSRRPNESLTAEWRVVRADGIDRQVEVLVRNLFNEPAVGGLVINIRDVTERKELEDRLSHQALHDDLTGLANRSLLRLRIEQALARWLFQDEPFSLLVVDLDHFKSINDSLGHVAGDTALRMAAERISECTRQTDTVVRLDGDEFAVLLEGVAATDEEAHLVAERISEAIQQPMHIEGRRLALRASIGLACVTEEVSQADDIMRNADLALHSAKDARRGGFVQFEMSMHDAALRRVELEADLRRALERDELQLYYQPTVDMATGKLEGVEALLRWPHPERGFISPVEFIPVAEESGLIVPIGTWVMEQACSQMARWQVRYPGTAPLTMNVNLSGRQFDQPDIVDVVRRVIDMTGIVPGSLVLEVTESVLMEDSENTRRKMNELVAIGCGLAIDDFGTGYSSLSYLQQYPITVLKIDRSFVNEIGVEGTTEEPALVRAILDIARIMRLQTVAEGIETKEQLAELRRMGCDIAQGFYLARPAPPEDVRRLIEATHAVDLPMPGALPDDLLS